MMIKDKIVDASYYSHKEYVILVEDFKEFLRELKRDTGCNPINSREEQIVAMFRERIDNLSGFKQKIEGEE